jgi:hypothetical protein
MASESSVEKSPADSETTSDTNVKYVKSSALLVEAFVVEPMANIPQEGPYQTVSLAFQPAGVDTMVVNQTESGLSADVKGSAGEWTDEFNVPLDNGLLIGTAPIYSTFYVVWKKADGLHLSTIETELPSKCFPPDDMEWTKIEDHENRVIAANLIFDFSVDMRMVSFATSHDETGTLASAAGYTFIGYTELTLSGEVIIYLGCRGEVWIAPYFPPAAELPEQPAG